MHHYARLTESSGSLGPTLTVVTVVCSPLPVPASNAARAAASLLAAAAPPECRRAGCRLPELQHSAGATLLEPVAQRRLLNIGLGRVGRLWCRCWLPTKL